jgi:hypothetical protein
MHDNIAQWVQEHLLNGEGIVLRCVMSLRWEPHIFAFAFPFFLSHVYILPYHMETLFHAMYILLIVRIPSLYFFPLTREKESEFELVAQVEFHVSTYQSHYHTYIYGHSCLDKLQHYI